MISMGEELNQFDMNKVWKLVPMQEGKSVFETKWVFRNKLDESEIVTRNMEILVFKGYCQQECIGYDETFTSMARLEAIMIVLTYVAHRNFKVF